MFERYLAEALATHFRHIISDFDSDKVKISVWNGEVVLRDLTLKQDALQQLEGGSDLPFKISYGHIGTFELRIPWNLLRLSQKGKKHDAVDTHTSITKGNGSSCSVILSDVDILISPGVSRTTAEEEKERDDGDPQAERIKKERMVQNILDEALFRKNIELAAVAEDDEKNSNTNSNVNSNATKSFVKNLMKNILSSLTVTVRNVHIRYEDPGDCIGFDTKYRFGTRRKTKIRHRPPFAIGVALEEFRLDSTERGPQQDDELYRIPDMDGVSMDNDNAASSSKESMGTANEGGLLYSIQHKLAAAKKLSIYWDSDISSKDLIHLTIQSIERKRKWEQRRKAAADDNDSSDEDFDDSDEEGDLNKVSSGNELFASMLNDALNSQDRQRMYIIQPISPSLHCTIVSAIHSQVSDESDKQSIPPSRAVLTLPPSQMNITKDTLEDIAYLRRSVALWNDMRTSLLTRQIYSELTRARPDVSPLEDPRGWWHYAFEAVTTLPPSRMKCCVLSSLSSSASSCVLFEEREGMWSMEGR